MPLRQPRMCLMHWEWLHCQYWQPGLGAMPKYGSQLVSRAVASAAVLGPNLRENSGQSSSTAASQLSCAARSQSKCASSDVCTYIALTLLQPSPLSDASAFHHRMYGTTSIRHRMHRTYERCHAGIKCEYRHAWGGSIVKCTWHGMKGEDRPH